MYLLTLFLEFQAKDVQSSEKLAFYHFWCKFFTLLIQMIIIKSNFKQNLIKNIRIKWAIVFARQLEWQTQILRSLTKEILESLHQLGEHIVQDPI